MPHNNLLDAALKNPKLLDDANVKAALDAILSADPAVVADFKKAFKDHEAVWKALGVPDPVEDIDENDNPNFVVLYKLATQKRVELGLKTTDPTVLEALITSAPDTTFRAKLVSDQSYKSTFGDLGNSKIVWNIANEDVLSAAAIIAIKSEAQKELLLKKIAACTKPELLEQLLNAKNDNNLNEFIEAAKKLGVAPPATAGMTLDIGEQVKHQAAAKGFELRVAAWTENAANHADIWNHLVVNDDAAFAQGTQDPYGQNLKTEDSPRLRGLFGAEYLKASLPLKTAADLDFLKEIGNTSEAESLQGVFNRKYGQDYKFIKESINAGSIVTIRQIAAPQALKLAIANCKDQDVLDKLSRETTAKGLQDILEKSPSLGFAGGQWSSFRKTFVDARIVQEIAVSARVKKDLRLIPYNSKNPGEQGEYLDKLGALIGAVDVPAVYLTQFHEGASEQVKALFKAYFKGPANVKMVQEEALLVVLKETFKKLDAGTKTARLNDISTAVNDNNLKLGVAAVLGGPKADALIAGISIPV